MLTGRRGHTNTHTLHIYLKVISRNPAHIVVLTLWPTYTSQAEMAADSSLTPSVALLMCLSGTVYYIMDHDELTKSQKSMLLKTDLDRLCICSSVIGVYR